MAGKKRTNSIHQAGFTLIEILMVVTLSVVITVAATGLFFTTLIGNTRKELISQVKDQGDYAINQLEFLLRNAVSLAPDPLFPAASTCVGGMNRITFKSVDEGITTLFNDNGKIASQSAASGQTIYLTTDDVTLTGPTFNCSQASENFGTYVTISFSLQKDSPDYNRPTPVQESFTTSVSLRNL